MLSRFSARRAVIQSKTTRVPTIAVNRLITMPSDRVTAKPLIGPVPNRKRAKAVIRVVTCASMIVTSARSKPDSTAARTVLPSRSYSRMRSKIRTFVSTPIPMVRAMPAIPGSVSVAPIMARAPTIMMRFRPMAKSASTPQSL